MVHISEVANSYVSDIKEFLKEGQQVSVKVINIDREGRINLSIKKAQQPAPGNAPRPAFERRPPPPAVCSAAWGTPAGRPRIHDI